MFAAVAGMLFLSVGLLGIDYVSSIQEIKGGIPRNSYGEGDETKELVVKNNQGESAEIELEIKERQYTQKETEKMFERCISKLEKKILGENKSLDRIEKNMNLVTELSGEEVDIAWELDRYDVMNVYGELKTEASQSEGTMVQLRAVLTYQANPSMQAVYECTAMIYSENAGANGTLRGKVLEAIEKENENTETKEQMRLPREIGDQTVTYFPKMEQRGIVLLCMTILIGILLLALKKQKEQEAKRERNLQMIQDYPEIMNKLTLLLGAGMIMRRAWKKIVDDYEAEKERWGIRYAYEEMKQTVFEMESGISEAESYERFGRRCKVQQYMKLGTLLSQNLRKGTKGLSQILKIEAIQAFEDRKAHAKQLGEEAGTKLLLPMFFMLGIVLVIVIVPAFLSIQL